MVLQTQYIDGLRVAGTVGLGLVAGMTVGTSTLFIPALSAALQPSERLRVWSRLYDLGKAQIPSLTILSSLSLAAATVLTDPEADLGLAAIHRRALLGAAAVTAISIIPFTFVVMIPGIKKLKAIEAKALSDALATGQESDALVARWSTQHAVRAGLLSIAFLFAATELLIC